MVWACLGALLVLAVAGIWLSSDSGSHLREDLKYFLADELVCVVPPLPPGVRVDAIYVLGGGTRSLQHRYKTAADLFHKGISRDILILSRPGITEYSSSLGRNLTNDEWSMRTLGEFGVPEEYIEAIEMEGGFWGTFSEAQGISSLVKKRSYKSVLLISTHYHTQRVKITFEHLLKKQGTVLFVQGAGGGILLRGHLLEYLKLKIYKYFLLAD